MNKPEIPGNYAHIYSLKGKHLDVCAVEGKKVPFSDIDNFINRSIIILLVVNEY